MTDVTAPNEAQSADAAGSTDAAGSVQSSGSAESSGSPQSSGGLAPVVLVLNCGSSSVKFAVLDPESGERHLTGLAERVGTPEASVAIARAGGPKEPVAELNGTDYHGIIGTVLEQVLAWAEGQARITAVGHRVVHGGPHFSESVLLDEAAVDEVRRVIPLAPLHNPAHIAGIESALQILPDVPQVAVFDTAFHHHMPPHAYRYAVPTDWYEKLGVRRYGFHGTSHYYVSRKAAEMLGRPVEELRIVTCHLGNGSSLAAVKNGVSVDTSMGLTPLEGIVMGTRSGDLDPGILGYVADQTGADVQQLISDLNKRSGLLGLSGVTNDMRELRAAADSGHEGASLALDVYVYRLAKYAASLVVPLGGIDALVFTGGIGENNELLRARVVAALGFLGFTLDEAANRAAVGGDGGVITTGDGPAALVVPTDEELVIAQDAHRLGQQQEEGQAK